MKKMLNHLALLVVILFMAVTAQAVVISTQPIEHTLGVTPSILIREGESVQYVLRSTAATLSGDFKLEYSVGSDAYRDVGISTASTAGGLGHPASFSGIVYASEFGGSRVRVRWRIVNSTGARAILELRDQDDSVMVVKSNKFLDTMNLYDDSLRISGSLMADKYTLQASSAGNVIYIASHTQFGWGPDVEITKRYTKHPITVIDKSWSVIDATATSVILEATPTISTETATNGDIVIFQVMTTTVTFTDNNSVARTALRVPSGTRAVKPNEIIAFLYYSGFWRELFYLAK